MKHGITFFIGTILLLPMVYADWPQYEQNPFEITMEIPAPENQDGGIIVADINNDGLMDYVVTVAGHIAAYAHDGSKLWIRQTDIQIKSHELPGNHAPGVIAGDIDSNGKTELLYLTYGGDLHVLDGESGELLWAASPPLPEAIKRWDVVVIANLRGAENNDVILQGFEDASLKGRFLHAYAVDDLRQGHYTPLWTRDDFLSCRHNGVRIADLDGTGRHYALGGSIISPDGEKLFEIKLPGHGAHLDSLSVAKVRDNIPGLQVVSVEEANVAASQGAPHRVFLYNHEGLIWESNYQGWEPQNIAVGNFDPARQGLEIWNRSRFNTNQKPFVLDAFGEFVSQYEMDNVAPEGWSEGGVEVINTIDWTGAEKQLAAAKERHTVGDVCIFDPITGEFIQRFSVKADRLYIADVSGDWREEVIILQGNSLRIFHNPEPNPRPNQPRLWEKDHYLRSKLTYNYYSP